MEGMDTSFFRPELSTLPAYVPGKKGADESVIKVASNELPFPTLPMVQAAINAHVGGLHRYPDMFATELTADIAAYHHVSVDNIAVSNGSSAMIEKALNAVAVPGAEVVVPWRSFESYPIAAQKEGLTFVPVPLRADGNADLWAMYRAITPATRAMIVCTPNNPTSAALTHSELVTFLAEVPSNVLVLLDEAYIDFVEMDDVVDGVAIVGQFPNVISLRTFSKAYSLAGLRIGYTIGAPEVISVLRGLGTPFGVSDLAQVAARAALQSRTLVNERIAVIKAEREKLVAALAAQGWTVPTPQANFVWFDLGERAAEFTEICAESGISVRTFAGEGTRVTIAEPEASLRLLRALSEFRKRYPES